MDLTIRTLRINLEKHKRTPSLRCGGLVLAKNLDSAMIINH